MAPMAAGPSGAIMMVSTVVMAIQPSSARATGAASAATRRTSDRVILRNFQVTTREEETRDGRDVPRFFMKVELKNNIDLRDHANWLAIQQTRAVNPLSGGFSGSSNQQGMPTDQPQRCHMSIFPDDG